MLLAIETSTSTVGISIGDAEGSRVSVRIAGLSRHAEMLVPAVQWCLAQSRLRMEDILAIAVDIGPGLFTGLRVGVASAKSFAFALGVPVIGVSSLDLLAWPHRWADLLVSAVIDARRGQCFWATYRCGQGACAQIGSKSVGTAQELLLDLDRTGGNEVTAMKGKVLFVGDGAWRYRGVLESAPNAFSTLAGSTFKTPDPEILLEKAVAEFAAGRFGSLNDLVPLYLRAPDAKVGWTARVSTK